MLAEIRPVGMGLSTRTLWSEVYTLVLVLKVLSENLTCFIFIFLV